MGKLICFEINFKLSNASGAFLWKPQLYGPICPHTLHLIIFEMVKNFIHTVQGPFMKINKCINPVRVAVNKVAV